MRWLLRAAFVALGRAGGIAEKLAIAKREDLERFDQDAFETSTCSSRCSVAARSGKRTCNRE